MFNIPQQDPTVNACPPLCKDSPPENTLPDQPSVKDFHQNVAIESTDHKAYLFNGTFNDEVDLLPICGYSLEKFDKKFASNTNIVIYIKINSYSILFNIPISELNNHKLCLPSIFFPKELLLDNKYKIEIFTLTIQDITYNLAWNIIDQVKFDNNYIIIVPVNIILSNYINKYKFNTYKYTFKDIYYAIHCQQLIIDGVKRAFLPKFIQPRKKFPLTIYLIAIHLYLDSKMGAGEVAKKIEELFGVKISRWTVLRSVKWLKDFTANPSEAPKAGKGKKTDEGAKVNKTQSPRPTKAEKEAAADRVRNVLSELGIAGGLDPGKVAAAFEMFLTAWAKKFSSASFCCNTLVWYPG
jgi:hypothetical protein